MKKPRFSHGDLGAETPKNIKMISAPRNARDFYPTETRVDMKYFLTLCLSLLLVLQSAATSLAATSTEASLIKESPRHVAILPPVDGIRQAVESYIKKHENRAASVAVAVFENQETIVSLHHGMADIAGNVQSNANTVYEWGSITKLLTWVSIIQLAERGKLALGDDITKYLPDKFLSKLEYNEPITFLHLLNHQAGWQETSIDIETQDIDGVLPLESALRQSEPPQIYEPGTTCAYSNWGCALAGFIVENISGMPFHEYVKRHIFIPLGMKHSALEATLSDNQWVYEQRRLLKCYQIDDENFKDLGKCIRHILLYPAGMATGTLDDLTKFAKALLPDMKGRSPLFEKAETLGKMMTPSLFYGNSSEPRISHGFFNRRYGVNTIGHPGNTAGCTANLLLDPLSGRGVVVMTNQSMEVTFTSGLMPLVFASPQQEEGEILRPVDSLAGYYLSTRTFDVGMLRILRFLRPGGMLALMKTDDPHKLKVALTGSEVRLVAPDKLNVSGIQMFVYKDKNGIIHLQNSGHNYIRQNTVHFLAKIILIMIIPVSVIYSSINILIRLMTLIINKKNSAYTPGVCQYQMPVHIAIIAIGICFYYISTADSYTISTMWLPCTLSTIFAMVPVLSLTEILTKRNKLKADRSRKIDCAASATLGLLMTFNVIYWQIFNFWV